MTQSITTNDWLQYFPLKAPRPEQERAINFALNAFVTNGSKFVLAELGTGLGKSAFAVTIARYLEANPCVVPPTSDEDENPSGAYIVTTQKVLQQQYVDDFGPAGKNLLRSLKSASNYTCSYYPKQSCGESRRVLATFAKKLSSTDFAMCCRTSCAYKIDKQEFIDSPLGITNFSFFLAETNYAKQLKTRALLIIDEAHTIEEQLGKFVEVTFSEKFARDMLKCSVPKLVPDDEKNLKTVFAWIKGKYKTSLSKYIQGLSKAMHDKVESDQGEMSEITKRYEMLDKHMCKVNRFIESFDTKNWVLNVVDPPPRPGSRPGKKFEFKPVDVAYCGHEMLYRFGDKVLMMSATIIDKKVFCESIGIDEKDVEYIRIPSTFPVENRPIHFLPAGNMSMSKIEESLPKITDIVKMIIDQHADQKGIIHACNYRIAKHLFENLKSPRVLIHNSDDREKVLLQHLESKEPTILLSPSMMEGVNLSDDASRFQIMCKVPFPYLGDKVVKKRKEKNDRWYAYNTVKSVVQAMGRSIRNETDHATSYILDSDWGFFLKKNREMFPEDFLRSIVNH